MEMDPCTYSVSRTGVYPPVCSARRGDVIVWTALEGQWKVIFEDGTEPVVFPNGNDITEPGSPAQGTVQVDVQKVTSYRFDTVKVSKGILGDEVATAILIIIPR